MENQNNDKLKFIRNFTMADEDGIFYDLNRYTYGDNFTVKVNFADIKPEIDAKNKEEDVEIHAIYDPEKKIDGLDYLISGKIISYFDEDIPQAERLQRDLTDAVEILKLIKNNEFSKENELERKAKYKEEQEKLKNSKS